jgi:hypothetical protein
LEVAFAGLADEAAEVVSPTFPGPAGAKVRWVEGSSRLARDRAAIMFMSCGSCR